MPTKSEITNLIHEEEEIRKNRIIAEKDGHTYVNFKDAATLNNAAALDNEGTGMRSYNADGSLASTGKTIHAMNPDFYFNNRYKVKGTGKAKRLYVVSAHTPEGFRLIQEQPSGTCYMKTIPCAVLARDDDGNLVLDKFETVSETEFISGFTHRLTNKDMAEILPLIIDNGSEITADEMPI